MNGRRLHILGMPVDVSAYEETCHRLIQWATRREHRFVCVSNVHMVMESYDDELFASVVRSADFVTADGMPLVWWQRILGARSAERVYGPTLTLELCRSAARAGLPIALYGGSEQSLDEFQRVLRHQFPDLIISCAISPPFRPLTEEEDRAYTSELKESGAALLLVGIGCPKQEKWMAAHKDALPMVQVGVGAAFDFHSGSVRQSPAWIQNVGLEWLFRLIMEPRRLWKRYFKHNPRFVWKTLLAYLTRDSSRLRLQDGETQSESNLFLATESERSDSLIPIGMPPSAEKEHAKQKKTDAEERTVSC